MNYDDPKLTAYALGEVDETIELDERAQKMVEATALVAGVLTAHYRRPRRGRRVMRYAMAASVVLIVRMLFLTHRPTRHETIADAPVEKPVVRMPNSPTPILRLMPAVVEAAETSSLSSANFRGIRSVDVEQLVAAVIQDASRVGSFTSLRLTPEAAVVFQ